MGGGQARSAKPVSRAFGAMARSRKCRAGIVLALAVTFFTAGCASDPEAPDDPLEPMNRFFFDFNQRLDRHAALPAASFYTSAVPRPVRGTVHNVLNNLGGPVTAANDVLQLEFENAGIAASRLHLWRGRFELSIRRRVLITARGDRDDGQQGHENRRRTHEAS